MGDSDVAWEAWAGRQYQEAAIAAAAAAAAISASAAGVGQTDATIRAHRAAVEAGGEYLCRTDRTLSAFALITVVGIALISLGLFRLSVDASAQAFEFLAIATAGFGLAIAVMVGVRKNSCFFANKETVGRRNWRSKVVESMPRSSLAEVKFRYPGAADAFLSRGADGPTIQLVRVGRSKSFFLYSKSAYWWTENRVIEFAQVIDRPLVSQ